MLPFDEVWAASANAVPGWLTRMEARALYDVAGRATEPVVEIGTFCGLSTCFLCAATEHPVYAVDPHDLAARNQDERTAYPEIDSLKIARAHWRRMGVAPKVVRKLSGDASKDVPSDIGLLFLDGDHRPAQLWADLELYATRIVPGGALAVHDWGSQGMANEWAIGSVVNQWLDGRDFLSLMLYGTLAVFKREANHGAD